MKLLVCVKYSADPSNTSGAYCTNPFDLFAMEMAARIKDCTGTQIYALTHGDIPSETALRDCLAAGADRAYRIDDEGDTARLFARIISEYEQRTEPFSAIFCGIQSIDGGSRYVGPALAELLQRPLIPNAIDAWIETDGIHIVQEGAFENCEWRTSTPCIISVTKPLFAPRYPTIRSRMAANRASIPLLHSTASQEVRTQAPSFTYHTLLPKPMCTFLSGTPIAVCTKLIQLWHQQDIF